MDLSLTIDKLRRVITTRLAGDLADADLVALKHEFESNPDFDRSYARICDMTDVTAVTVSDELIKRWALDPVMDRPARHALICNKPAVMKSVLQFVAESRKDLRQVLVFPSYSDAEAWIAGSGAV